MSIKLQCIVNSTLCVYCITDNGQNYILTTVIHILCIYVHYHFTYVGLHYIHVSLHATRFWGEFCLMKHAVEFNINAGTKSVLK